MEVDMQLVDEQRLQTEAPRLHGFDHLEWWVGNARHTAQYWSSAFGFEVEAYAGPETGVRDRTSYVVRQGDIRFVVTSALDADHPVAKFVALHGDGVRDVAYAVTDSHDAYRRLLDRGAESAIEPSTIRDDHGSIERAAVHSVGETIHSLIDRSDYGGVFLPGYEAAEFGFNIGEPVGLERIDHVVTNVGLGELDDTVAWYERVFGFGQLQHFSEEAIATEYSALRSTVVSNGGSVVMPINEPAAGRRKSQIEEYLDYFGSAGVQHVAMRTTDIISAVASMRDRGVRFMRVPDEYYDEAPGRVADLGIDLPWARLAELGILVDRDSEGYLLQVFTENVASRPTAFMEVIQREGARGFGEGNFKALFTSIEREQARRGNL
jgi:4-hydroxyphenylpyruvate dioxygenase